MRIALLSAIKRDEVGDLRAEHSLAARSILSWQADFMLELGCEKIICLCEAPSPEVLLLQREMEGAGNQFHIVRNNLQLVSLLRADDRLTFLQDGLLPPRSLIELINLDPEKGARFLATLSSDHGMPATHPDDFERIDRDRNWGGYACVPARVVQKLADLPPDSDAISMLLRLALQTKVPCRDVSEIMQGDDSPLLATSPQALSKYEARLVKDSSGPTDFSAPTRSLIDMLVRRSFPRGLAQGSESAAALAGVLLAVSIVLSVLGWVISALGVAACGSLAAMLSHSWTELRDRLWGKPSASRFQKPFSIAVELTLATTLAISSALSGYGISTVSLAVLAIGISYLCSEESRVGFWRERPLHLIFLLVLAVFGHLEWGFAALALLATAHLLIIRRKN